jgi:hypothetical protein
MMGRHNTGSKTSPVGCGDVTTNDTSSKTISVSCGDIIRIDTDTISVSCDIIRIDTISVASSAGHNNLILADNGCCYISVGLSNGTRTDTTYLWYQCPVDEVVRPDIDTIC